LLLVTPIFVQSLQTTDRHKNGKQMWLKIEVQISGTLRLPLAWVEIQKTAGSHNIGLTVRSSHTEAESEAESLENHSWFSDRLK
jgi:hypothetical protein